MNTTRKVTAIELARQFSMSKNGVYGWRARGEGPISHKFDHDVFFYESELVDFLKASYVNHQNHDPFTNGEIMQDVLVNEIEAAKILQVDISYVRRWRHNDHGPSHFKLGKLVRYRPTDLYAYALSMNGHISPERALVQRKLPFRTIVVPPIPELSAFRRSWLGRLLAFLLF